MLLSRARAARPTSAVDRLDVPRSREGLSAYYSLLAMSNSAISHSGRRWLFDSCEPEYSIVWGGLSGKVGVNTSIHAMSGIP